MKKRAAVVLLFIITFFACVGIRIVDIGKNAEPAGNPTASFYIDVGTVRGTIYDRALRPLVNSELETYAAAKPTCLALSVLSGVLPEREFESVAEKAARKKPAVMKVEADFSPNSDIKIVKIPKRYASGALARHIIGYLGPDGGGISGAEAAFDELLSAGSTEVGARFFTDARGGALLGEDIVVEGAPFPKAGVALTIDADVQRITEKALDDAGAEKAAAVVIDVESGAIRACASRPQFDPNDVAKSLDDQNSPLINRALLPFAVGSAFKPVVAAAALENGASEDFRRDCKGNISKSGVVFNCHKRDGHGALNMKEALSVSCNVYFIELAIETGAEKIIETASKFGFGKETVLAGGIRASSGRLPAAEDLDSSAAVANIAFGQGPLTATPLQICNMAATIARGGIYVGPRLVEGKVNADGELIRIKEYVERKRIISESTAEKLMDFLANVVSEGSGKRASSVIVSAAGKTATAQTGAFINGEEIYNAWFAGYFPAEKPKYAVAVLKENGGEGAISCAPIFREIAEKTTILFG